MVTDILLAPPLAFALFVLISFTIDRVGNTIASDRADAGEAFRTAWASGEEPPESQGRPRYRLYHVGIGFTIIHVAVLLVATIPIDANGAILGVPLLAVVGLALFAIVDAGRPQPGR
ncbi:hypothetical protein HLRTI_000575 [Halorhabdus tiamatea SARL4B]|uniref:Uncharacterized protein n=1 Tax=Halorhabdus tiamatea SARL4B TaxID=1033806 RepID=F7PQ38_9EURY|nr:hypothetical protein [Halorhabdus tiamatea]ERJ07217.1 hypothetical protein HLRTI_000575 [Halorhabdus tiamatea SARL4B]CCQ34130.1 hypothetical protein HTIA_2016 [Halorhabdus tiamatea SARL4B]